MLSNQPGALQLPRAILREMGKNNHALKPLNSSMSVLSDIPYCQYFGQMIKVHLFGKTLTTIQREKYR